MYHVTPLSPTPCDGISAEESPFGVNFEAILITQLNTKPFKLFVLPIPASKAE